MTEKYIDKLNEEFCDLPLDIRIRIILKREFDMVYPKDATGHKIEIVKLEKPRLDDNLGWFDGYYQKYRNASSPHNFSLEFLSVDGYFINVHGDQIQDYKVMKPDRGLRLKKGDSIGPYKIG